MNVTKKCKRYLRIWRYGLRWIFAERLRGLDFSMRDYTSLDYTLNEMHSYSATPPHHFREILKELDFDHARSFLDIGCGKGIALKLAKKHPGFKKCQGIEYNKKLADIATRNMHRLRMDDVTIWNGDAREFKEYENFDTFYLFNPFGPDIFSDVIQKIPSHGTTLIYHHPTCHQMVNSKKLDKKMQLVMSGEETELDRTVVDEIGDPLMHLLRNSADHGLESSQKRLERGKPETGTIFLKAYQDGNNVIIEVGDDGNGIDVEAVKQKAIERGTITHEQAENMTDKEIIGLLFLPSFSTAKQVSDISGRGVGLDVVKSKIESLSGEVDVKTKLGEGSTWIIRLPLTLAIIQALMVEVGGEKYAISLGSIQTIEDIEPSEIRFVGAKEVINLRGTVIPLIRLNEVLDSETTKSPDENLLVIIVKKGDQLAGLVVDELMGQQEIVIKSLGKYINKCKIISGATILGDGEIALIIDTNALL